MLEEFLKQAVGNILGKQNEELALILNSKKPVNEFIIAKKLEITINQTRNLLYRLADNGIILSMRKKDKKKGWYTYFWRLDIVKTLEFLKTYLLNRKTKFEEQIKSRETEKFYICKRCELEYNEENALLLNFTCDECGDVFELKDNTKVLKGLKRQLEKINNEINELDKELEKAESKVEKKKAKELKIEAEEKIRKRREKREKNKALKEKLNKKTSKKKTKKKPAKKKSKKKTKKKSTKKKSKKKKSKKTSKKKTSKKK